MPNGYSNTSTNGFTYLAIILLLYCIIRIRGGGREKKAQQPEF